MDIRSLACFVSIAETLSFRRSAERLNITQPALSQRIRALEAEIAVRLLERDRRHVGLTPSGAAFLEPARAAVAYANLAKLQAKRAADGEVGVLRLGFTVIAFYSVLPEAVRAYRARYPQVAVELTEMVSPLLERALEEGSLDLGVLHPPLEARNLGKCALPDQQLVLALPQAHPLASCERISAKDLAGQPFLLPPRSVGPRIYDRLIAYFQKQGINPRVVQEVTPMTTLTAFVSAGEGLGFVTEGIAAVPRPGVVFRPLSPAPPSLPMAVAWRGKMLPPVGRRFLDVFEDVLGASAAKPLEA